MQLNRNKNAIELFKKAIELEPQYADAYYNLAGIYAFFGMEEQAYENLEKSLLYFNAQGRSEEAREFERAFREYFYEKVPGT